LGIFEYVVGAAEEAERLGDVDVCWGGLKKVCYVERWRWRIDVRR
jgi:hypothetical protein